jgi:signal peptidase
MRTVEDFNREYLFEVWVAEEEEAARPRKGAAARNALFYLALAALVLLALFYSGNDSSAKRFGPFAYNTVVSGSMRSVYPKGSLITSWAVKPGEPLRAGLENGSDIVFVTAGERVVVHRVIEIVEDYEDSGQRGFRTQGVDNPSPDNWVIFEANIIGRVTWHVPYVGTAMAFVAQYVLWIIGLFAAICVIFLFWRYAFSKEKPKGEVRAKSRKTHA